MDGITKSEHIKTLAFFLILSIWFTFPMFFKIDGITTGDGFLPSQNIWWFKKAISTFQNPFYTDYIFYPNGTSLVFQGSQFSNFLLTLPVSITAGVNAGVNAAYILSFILSGYFAFLLAHELTGNKYASIIAGIVYGFNPFRVRGVGHLNVVTMQWLPLYLLMLKRASERKDNKWSIMAGAVFGIIILTDQLNTILATFVTVALIPFLFFQHKACNNSKHLWQISLRQDSIKNIKVLLTIASIAFIVSGWYLFQLIQVMLEQPDALKVGPFEHGGANTFSGDLMGYLLPSPNHLIWGKYTSPYIPGGENILFLGYIPLLLAVAGSVKFFHKDIVKSITAITFLFWVLSLGTTLHVGGTWQWNGEYYSLPFSFLSGVPFIGNIRTPCRLHIVTTLGVSLLAAYGITGLLYSKSSTVSGIKNWKIYCLAGLILLEFFPAPAKLIDPLIPKIYLEMAKDKEPYTILELPLSRWSSLSKNGSGSPHIMLYFQSIHEKKIFNGFLPRTSAESLDFKDEILDLFTKLTWHDNYEIVGWGKRLPTESELAEVRLLGANLSPKREEFFKRYNIHYIVMHVPIASGTLTRAFVEAFTGKTAVYVPQDGLSYVKVQ